MSAVVSSVAAYGAVVSVPTAVHVPGPVERSKTTWAMPAPPVSAAVAVSWTLPRRFAPGSPCVAVGACVSTFATAVVV